MISDDLRIARSVAAMIALRHIDETSESDREMVLVALVDALPEAHAKLAQDALFNLREARRLQLELVDLVFERKS